MSRPLVTALLVLCASAPAFAQTHFHHAHLNSVDPAAAIEFYTTHLSGERASFDDRDAVWTQKSWLLFTKVKQAPPSDIVSPLFHIGWGAEDMKAEFERQMKLGTTFQTVLTDGVELFGAGTRDRNFFMHVHLFSDDPVAAAAWYRQHLAIATRTKLETVRAFRGIPTGPSASMQLDNVTFWIYPTAHAKALYGGQWRGRTGFATNRGRALDHVALSVDHLDATLARLKQEGVRIVSGPRKVDGVRSAFIEAPDKMELELVEGQPKEPVRVRPRL
jgi:catechol 2,3-dioxygenase-like lactoylglutathione lyase family enzyme